ncbi:MAG TPA: D-alanyl-D-alanine carboxypeptidase [Steroidobacteraceae bacterium]|jgi:D-alanyl-D-alanine carboxypeptidase/D-alanyl-D-alanine-endopeptidase (penicillin-binding protein 4)|nr:D-alanyl-D-alanine carboxypeptidase [Steroidobacteraceae bacterium]
MRPERIASFGAQPRTSLGALCLAGVLAGLSSLSPQPVAAADSDAGAVLARAARQIVGADQGVYVEAADGHVLLAQAEAHPVHPASVSKVPTTLALLRMLGPDYRFVTTFSVSGHLAGNRLDGQLVVQAGTNPDPALVDEDALLVAQRLNGLGIDSIRGPLRVQGPLMFDWQNDPQGDRLAHALSGQTPPAAWNAVLALQSGAAHLRITAPPSLQWLSAVDTAPVAARDAISAKALPVLATPTVNRVLTLRSEPLLPLLKSLDDYSNNIVALLAQAAGGAAAVQRLARASVPEPMRAEITLGDGAGVDPRNRLSPRAAVKLLRALEQQLATSGHSLPDVLPVSGVDAGTLHDRLNGADAAGRVVGKTGTYGDYGASALIGAIRTRDQGEVYFAILNHGLPVPVARRRQDAFVRVLLAHLTSVRWQHAADALPAIARAQLVSAP